SRPHRAEPSGGAPKGADLPEPRSDVWSGQRGSNPRHPAGKIFRHFLRRRHDRADRLQIGNARLTKMRFQLLVTITPEYPPLDTAPGPLPDLGESDEGLPPPTPAFRRARAGAGVRPFFIFFRIPLSALQPRHD